MNNSGKGKLMNNFLFSINKNYFLSKLSTTIFLMQKLGWEKLRSNIDNIRISETKLDESFSSVQFRLKRLYTPYSLEGNSKGGGL